MTKTCARPPGRDGARGGFKTAPPRALTLGETDLFFAGLSASIPDPRIELDFRDPFTLLVAVVLSAQSTDKGVNVVTKKLFALADTPESMADLDEAAIRDALSSIGLFRVKAGYVRDLSRILVSDFDGRVPRDRESLMTLPGVGRKTANVVLNVAFGEETFPVDTHVFRVSNRTGLAPAATVRRVEDALERRVPTRYRRIAHHLLVLHGRRTCTARRPGCAACAVRHPCRTGGGQVTPGRESARRS